MTEKIITTLIFNAIREKLVVEGWTPDIKLIPNIDSTDPDLAEPAWETYNQQSNVIKASKGYCIQPIGFSSNQYRDDKKVARIVVDIQSALPTALGNDTTVYYEKQGAGTIENPAYYIRKRSISLLSDIYFSIYAIGSNTNQVMVMNELIMEIFPHRGYLKPEAQAELLPTGNFFVTLTDKGRTTELPVGIIERYYIYKISDIQEIPDTVLAGTIPLIKEINVISETVIPN